MKNIAFKLSIVFLGSLLALSFFPSLMTPYRFDQQLKGAFLLLPSWNHWLGTDELGRDLLARVLFGARVSMGCALLSTLIAGTVGIVWGTMSGYKGGWQDQFLMRLVDIFYAVPDLLFYILLGLFLGRDFWGILLSLSILGWLDIARITRGEIIKYKNLPFAEGATALGLSPWRLVLYHLLPQARQTLFAALILRMPAVILAESTLSFIGLGLTPPYASWGTLASEGYAALQFYPHLILFPSLFIFLTIYCLQTLGNKLAKINLHQ